MLLVLVLSLNISLATYGGEGVAGSGGAGSMISGSGRSSSLGSRTGPSGPSISRPSRSASRRRGSRPVGGGGSASGPDASASNNSSDGGGRAAGAGPGAGGIARPARRDAASTPSVRFLSDINLACRRSRTVVRGGGAYGRYNRPANTKRRECNVSVGYCRYNRVTGTGAYRFYGWCAGIGGCRTCCRTV